MIGLTYGFRLANYIEPVLCIFKTLVFVLYFTKLVIFLDNFVCLKNWIWNLGCFWEHFSFSNNVTGHICLVRTKTRKGNMWPSRCCSSINPNSSSQFGHWCCIQEPVILILAHFLFKYILNSLRFGERYGYKDGIKNIASAQEIMGGKAIFIPFNSSIFL